MPFNSYKFRGNLSRYKYVSPQVETLRTINLFNIANMNSITKLFPNKPNYF